MITKLHNSKLKIDPKTEGWLPVEDNETELLCDDYEDYDDPTEQEGQILDDYRPEDEAEPTAILNRSADERFTQISKILENKEGILRLCKELINASDKALRIISALLRNNGKHTFRQIFDLLNLSEEIRDYARALKSYELYLITDTTWYNQDLAVATSVLGVWQTTTYNAGVENSEIVNNYDMFFTLDSIINDVKRDCRYIQDCLKEVASK